MRVLGISAFHQDSAAALVVDGEPVAAAQEDLFSKTPLDASLPLRAARACLERAGLSGPELDRVVFYEKPLKRFERTLVDSLRAFPRGGRSFAREVGRWLGDRLWLKGRLADELGVSPRKVAFVDHMLAHAACAYYPSPFAQAAVLVVDDLGEWATSAVAHGRGRELSVLRETHLPHSLGLAVSAFTQFLGFDPGVDDGLLADLALRGKPRFAREVAELLPPAEDGGTRVAGEHFNFCEGAPQLYGERFVECFGEPRVPGSPLRTRDADLAASVQEVVTERVLELARGARELTGCDDLCFGGVMARNRGVVTALLEHGPFQTLYVPPEPCDAGAALGAALYVHHAEGDADGELERASLGHGPCEALRLGEALTTLTDLDERPPQATGQGPEALLPDLLAGHPVAWVRGALEFASESLTRRLALADPAPADARGRLLGALQRSESFLACRVALPAESLGQWVELPQGSLPLARLAQLQLRARPALADAAPGAVLPDGRVWVQAVDAQDDPELHDLLLRFGAQRGLPALLVATLRLRGSVVPRSDHEALEAFDRSGLGAIQVEDRLYGTPVPV